jgi:DUF2075 family protein
MPLADSGAALFAGSASDFITMAPASSLTAHITAEFNRRWGKATDSEIRSWRNSLTALAKVVDEAGIDTAGVGVELKLPHNAKRVDVSLIGRDEASKPTVALVELKQWDSASPSQYPDNVVVGAKELLHPSLQASVYADVLRDTHSAFTEMHFGIQPCVYLHNMSRTNGAALRGTRYAGMLRDAPLFTGEDNKDFGLFLRQRVGGGDGVELLPALVNGRYLPSQTLLAGLAQSLNGESAWRLLDEQRTAYNIVRGMVERLTESDERSVLIVLGGPGTGKSVIAAHLLVDLAKDSTRQVVHATGSKAFTTNLRALLPKQGAASSIFAYTNGFNCHKTPEKAVDVVLCDEAHRLRITSTEQYTRKELRSDLTQAQELIRASKVAVFFLDQRQNVRLGEIGTIQGIRDAAADYTARVEELELSGQFRCNGSNAYIEWIDALMSDRPVPATGWRVSGEYRFDVYDDPAIMERELLGRIANGGTGRMVAGYCWPWTDPLPDGTLFNDVAIDGWKRPWNAKSPEQMKPSRPAPQPHKHPYYLWATSDACVTQVGCIYSAQGFEFEHCGVILGNDLVWREGLGWVASKDASFDSKIKRRRYEGNALKEIVWNTYRVLLTRGMQSTLVYSTDFETRRFLKTLVK